MIMNERQTAVRVRQQKHLVQVTERLWLLLRKRHMLVAGPRQSVMALNLDIRHKSWGVESSIMNVTLDILSLGVSTWPFVQDTRFQSFLIHVCFGAPELLHLFEKVSFVEIQYKDIVYIFMFKFHFSKSFVSFCFFECVSCCQCPLIVIR